MHTRQARHRIAAVVISIAFAACSGGNDNGTPTTPTGGGGTPTTPTPTTTVTITSSGVSPKAITVAAGSRVTFVNNDSRSHDISSNPHPEHTDCPPINDVGNLTPGQSRLTGNLNTVRTCGYHDHDNPSNTSLQGTIVIQ
jgi:plastocyanin